MPIGFALNERVTVKRRHSTGRDSLNNPTYGTPTNLPGWETIYDQMPARIALSQKKIEFAPTGERIKPYGTVYFPLEYALQHEDRILTSEAIEYVIVSLNKAHRTPTVADHWEGEIDLP